MSGLLTHPPSQILLRSLRSLGLVTDPANDDEWPGFYNKHPGEPVELICIYDTTGTIQGKTHVDRESQIHDGIQIKARSIRAGDGYVKLNTILYHIDNLLRTEVTIDSSNYRIQAVTPTSPVISLGKDPEDHNCIHTLNVVMSVREF